MSATPSATQVRPFWVAQAPGFVCDPDPPPLRGGSHSKPVSGSHSECDPSEGRTTQEKGKK